MQKRFEVPRQGRLQIALSNGYEPNIVLAALALTPIRIEVEGWLEGQYHLLVSFPQGMNINVLESTQEHHPFYADTYSSQYTRLFVHRKPGVGVVLTGDLTASELLETRKKPWVIEPRRNEANGMTTFELMVACYPSVKIDKTEVADLHIAHDPFSIPDGMMRLLSILDEAIPSNDKDRLTLSRRLKNIRDIFAWYEKKLLTDKTREEVKICSVRLLDFQLQVDGNKESGGRCDADQVDYPENTLEALLSPFKDEEGFGVISEVINMDNWPLPPIHECGVCGAEAELQTRTVNTSSGDKEVRLVHCTSCKNQSARNDWGLAAQTIAVWNKQNGAYIGGVYPPAFDFEQLNQHEIHAKIKQLNTLCMKVIPVIKQLPPTGKESLGFVVERVTEMQTWLSYIKQALRANSGR